MVTVTSTRVDFERPPEYRDEIRARADRVRWLEIPARRYLMIDGTGVPGGEEFQDAIASLYPVAYTLHFALKQRAIEAPVGALEGLFWTREPGPINDEEFRRSAQERRAWSWRLMLPAPDAATDADIQAAVDAVRTRKPPPLIDAVRVEAWDEGPAAQVMHIGPYADEPPTIGVLHDAIAANRLRMRGCHHEIYLSDPNRTAPERLRTLIRQPVEPV